MCATWQPHRFFVLDLDKATYEANTEPMLSHINVGSGEDISIADLVTIVAKETGFEGDIVYDSSKPDGNHAQVDGCQPALPPWAGRRPSRLKRASAQPINGSLSKKSLCAKPEGQDQRQLGI